MSSMTSGRVLRIPREGRREETAYYQTPRNVTHSQIFWMKMAVPFTSVASEIVPTATQPQGFDILVRGAWTDLTNARVQLKEGTSSRTWSTASVPYIPVRAIMGNSNQVQPLVYFPIPTFLEAQAILEGVWQNQGTEAAGTACFYTEKAGKDPGSDVPYDGQIKVTRSMMFWMLIDLGKVTGTTDPINNDCLIWGATTNAAVAITGRITNETTNYSWSSQTIPLRAMAGVDGQVQPIMRYNRPYLLPNNVQMRVDINTAVTGNYIAFLTERVLA